MDQVDLSGLLIHVGSKTIGVHGQWIFLRSDGDDWRISAVGLDRQSVLALTPWVQAGSYVSISAVTDDGQKITGEGHIDAMDGNLLQFHFHEAPTWGPPS